jgi:N-formylglutamate deformylase
MPATVLPGVLALHPPEGEPIPLVFDSPHSGALWPDDFRPAAPEAAIRATEDSFVNELFGAAPAQGAFLLEALFPRAYIDPNRALADLDPELLAGPWPEPLAVTKKSALGKGLIWRKVPPGHDVYDRKLAVAEVQGRIERCWRPYHAALGETIIGLSGRFGRVWHVDCHSMKSVGTDLDDDGAGSRRPDFILGDRDGTACEAAFTRLVREFLERAGHRVAVNDPYKGVELVRAWSDPAAGRHSLQIEVRRDLYMDETTRAKHEGFATLQATLGGLVGAIAGYVRGQLSAR